MRRLVLSTALVAGFVVLPGCSWLFGNVNQEFAEASKEHADNILPEYENYLDADESLDEDSRRIRKTSAAEWRALIDEALSDKE